MATALAFQELEKPAVLRLNANGDAFEEELTNITCSPEISIGNGTCIADGLTMGNTTISIAGAICYDTMGRLVDQGLERFRISVNTSDLATMGSATTISSSIGHGFVQDSTGTLSIGAETQTALAYLSNSLIHLNTNTGQIGTIYVTVTPGTATVVLRNPDVATDGRAVFWPHPSIKHEVSRVIRKNLLIKDRGRNKGFSTQWSAEEQKARDTLRDMLTEKDWRRYMTNGFVMKKGASGNWYQIFSARREKMQVYYEGKRTHRICIHSDSSCPPSDHVINMMVMIDVDERWVWQNGNVSSESQFRSWDTVLKELQQKESILDAYRRLKANPVQCTMGVTGSSIVTYGTGQQFAFAC